MDPRLHPIKAVVDTHVTVGVNSTEVRPVTERRAELDLTNDSTQDIYLGHGHAAVIGNGKMLAAGGGSYHMGDRNRWKGTINAICQDGQANLCISEGTF